MFYSMKGMHVVSGWPDQRTIEAANKSAPTFCKKGWYVNKDYNKNCNKITEDAFDSAWKIRVWASNTNKDYTYTKYGAEFPIGEITHEDQSFASLDTPCHQSVMKRSEYYCSPVALAAIAAVGVAVSPVMLVAATGVSLINKILDGDVATRYLRS